MATLKESTFNGTNGSHFKLRLDYTYTQDQANSKTVIRLSNYFVSMDGYSGSGGANSVTGYVNGTKVGTTDSISRNTSKLLGYKDVEVTHNADGTFPSTAYTASIQTGWSLGEANVSGNITSSQIPKIDRYPILLTAPNFTDEDNPTITYSTNIGFENARTYAYIGRLDWTGIISSREVNISDGSYTFELTDSERNALRNETPNSNTIEVLFLLLTQAGGNNYWSTMQRTLTIINANPTFNVAYQDTNATTLAITNNNQQIIQNNSTLQVNITNATALKGSTLSSVDININGVITTDTISTATKDLNIGTINVANNINATVILKDSRNNTTTITLPITVLGWSLPTALITLNRKNNYYTETDIKVDANYSSLDSKNVITLKFRTKKTTEQNYGAYTTLQDNVTATFNADNTYEWDVQVLVQDLIGSTTYNLTLGKGQPIMFVDRRLRNVGIDCFADSTNAFEVNGKAKISGELEANGVNLTKTHSTSAEVLIGYDDNNKPIYRRIIKDTKVSGTNLQISASWVSDIDDLIRFDGTLKSLSNYDYPLARYESSSMYVNLNINRVEGWIMVSSSTGNYSNGDVIITVEYTKL